MTNENRSSCDLFGTGYDREEESCRTCKHAEKCQIESEHERNLINAGVTPTIPKALPSPLQEPFIRTTKPMETISEVLISIRFNKKVLRKLLGWGSGAETAAKGLNTEFIFKTLEKLRARFADRPDVLAEIEAILNEGL